MTKHIREVVSASWAIEKRSSCAESSWAPSSTTGLVLPAFPILTPSLPAHWPPDAPQWGRRRATCPPWHRVTSPLAILSPLRRTEPSPFVCHPAPTDWPQCILTGPCRCSLPDEMGGIGPAVKAPVDRKTKANTANQDTDGLPFAPAISSCILPPGGRRGPTHDARKKAAATQRWGVVDVTDVGGEEPRGPSEKSNRRISAFVDLAVCDAHPMGVPSMGVGNSGSATPVKSALSKTLPVPLPIARKDQYRRWLSNTHGDLVSPIYGPGRRFAVAEVRRSFRAPAVMGGRSPPFRRHGCKKIFRCVFSQIVEMHTPSYPIIQPIKGESQLSAYHTWSAIQRPQRA